MKLKVLCSLAILALATPILHAQSSPYSLNVFPAQIFTASGQSGTPIQLNGLSSSTSTIGSSYTSGTITVTGTSLSTVTFSLMGSADNGATYFALPVYTVATPASPPSTTITATANGLYQVNLAGLTHVKFVTSATFTATNVSLTLTATPNGTVSRLNSAGGGATIESTTKLLKGVSGGNQGVPAAFADVVGLFNGGSCAGFLKADGSCPTSAGATLTNNALLFGTSTTSTRPAVFGDVAGLWASGSCAGFMKGDGSCPTTVPSGAGGADTQVQLNASSALNGSSLFTYTDGSGLRLQNISLANRPQNSWSATAYNTGGNTGGANGLATIFANSTFLAAPSRGILMEPDYTEFDSASLFSSAAVTSDRFNVMDMRQGTFHRVANNPGPSNGANQGFFDECNFYDNPGSSYGGSPNGTDTQMCKNNVYLATVPGYYYGTVGTNFWVYTTTFRSTTMKLYTASIDKSYDQLSYFDNAAGDVQVRDEAIANGYGGGDFGSDEGFHYLRQTISIGGNYTATLGTNTSVSASGYNQLWFSTVPGPSLGVGRWLMDVTTATTDTITTNNPGDGTGDVYLTMTGSSYPVSTATTLTADVIPSKVPGGTGYFQIKQAATITVSTTVDLSTAQPLTPTPPTYQFVGIDSTPECGLVKSYGAFNSGAHIQTVSVLISAPHLAGGKLYIGGMACHGATVDAQTTAAGGVTSMYYVVGSTASNTLVGMRMEGGNPSGAFLGGAVHIYSAARVLDVRPIPPDTNIDDYVKVEEGPAFSPGDILTSGLMATSTANLYQQEITDSSPLSQGYVFSYQLDGSTMGSVGASGTRGFLYIHNTTDPSEYSFNGGQYHIGDLFSMDGVYGNIFNMTGAMHGNLLQNFNCGFGVVNTFNSNIKSVCAGSGGLPGWQLNGDVDILGNSSGQVVASFSNNPANGITFTRNAVFQGNTAAATLILNAPTGIGATDTLRVNGNSSFIGNIALSGNLTGDIVSGSINMPSQTNCTAAFNHTGDLGCNTGTLSAGTFEAQTYLISNGTPGQDIGFINNFGGTIGFNALANGFGTGFFGITADQQIALNGKGAGANGGTVFQDGKLFGEYGNSIPGLGLNLYSSNNLFGESGGGESLTLNVGDFAATTWQEVFSSHSATASGQIAGVLLNGNGGVTAFGGMALPKTYTVSALPTGSSNPVPAAGYEAMVSDATAYTPGSAPTGGGSIFAPVFYSGTGWLMY